MPGEISWGERILASDPGNVRIALATRAALSLAVALAVSALLASALGLHGTAAIVVVVLGAVLTMMTTFTAADPTTRGRVVTQLCLPVAMVAGIALSTLVDRHRVLSLSLFVVVMFVVVWVRRFGPRAFACGMVIWMGYFMALFLQLGFAQLPVVLVAVASTTVLLLVIALLVAPQRPARRMRRMVQAFRARVRIAALEHRDPAARSPWQRWTGRAGTPDRALLCVDEVAVLVDGQLAVPRSLVDPAHAPAVRAAILRVEGALARLLDTPPQDVRPPDVGAVQDALRRLDEVLDDDRRATPAPARSGGRAAPFTPAAELFAGFLPGSAVTVGPMVAPEDAGPKLLLTTRQALQIALAGGLSIALGDALSGQRWYWAVLACFLAFTGTATAAETVRKALQRAAGTAVGVAVALVVVPVLGSSTVVSLTVILGAIFVGFYLFRVSYTCLAFAITIMVAELYELLGSYSDGLLALRVGETALGALVGGVVAVSFLPASAAAAEQAACARLAEELRAATLDVATVLRDGPGSTGADGEPVDLHARVRSLDAAVHQLALIGLPLSLRSVPGAPTRRAAVTGRLSAWVRCAARVRAVIHAVEDAVAGAVDAPRDRHATVQEAMSAVQGLVDALADGRDPGEHAEGPARAGNTPELLVGELSALHGALLALHEVDPTVHPVGPSGATGRGDPATPHLAGPAAAGTARCAVRGRVTDEGDRGLDAVVTVVDPHGRQLGRLRTDAGAGGRFTVPVGEERGPWLVVVVAAGFAPHAGRAAAGPEHRVVLAPARRAVAARRTAAVAL